MAAVGVGSFFFSVVFFYVGAIAGRGNHSIREDNATTAAGGTFLHQR